MIRIFIASPYTNGDKLENVKLQMQVADALIRFRPLLFAPFIPLLFHYQNEMYPQPEEVWREIDLEYLKGCHAVLRLKGESTGADAEVAMAKRNGIPVFFNVPDLIRYFDD